MHPKNPFIEDYNFDVLIGQSPSLTEFVFINEYGTKTIKFGDSKAVKALNTALLKYHYGVIWDIPEKNLCPPIPGRLDYLLHIGDLIPKSRLNILDIGTGANLIYPILATCHFNWTCTGTEVDRESIQNAHEIIERNNILRKIELRHQKFKKYILTHIIRSTDKYDVAICNPPFYKNQVEAQQKNQQKAHNLKLEEKETQNFGGLSNELWYKGGEEAFIKKMALESRQFKDQIQWFTSLVSNKEHISSLKRAIGRTRPTQIKIIEMQQGNKKSRFIAWTFR